MTQPIPSLPQVKAFNKLNACLTSDALFLAIRLLLVLINFFFIRDWLNSTSIRAAVLVVAPIFFLSYALVGWFGPRFANLHITNLILSGLDIFASSVFFHFLPDNFRYGQLFICSCGIIINTLYGGVLTSIALSCLTSIGLATAVFRYEPVNLYKFFHTVVNFNLITLLFGLVGLQIKRGFSLLEKEKEESKKQLYRLQTLSRIAKEITSELEIDKLLMLIVQKTTDLTKAKAGGVIIFDTDRTYRIKAASGISKSSLGLSIVPGIGLGRALTERKTIFLNRAKDSIQLDLENYQHAIVSPILAKEDSLGLIFLLNNQANRAFTKDDQLILETMCEYASIGMVNANLFKATTSLSVNDYLTGVGNLRYFYQQLEHCIAVAERYREPCSLMMIDSDCFREIKNTYGNALGFKHIKQLADILKNTVRNSDLIARYDRDVFMIILPHTNLEEAIILGERIRARVAESPFNVEGNNISTTVCIGIANYPSGAINAQSLVAEAESALCQATKLGANNLSVAPPKT